MLHRFTLNAVAILSLLAIFGCGGGGGTGTVAPAGDVARPTFSVPSGATIRYTSDNTTPTATSGTIYTGPVPMSLNTAMTIKALAIDGAGSAYIRGYSSPPGSTAG